MDRNKAWDAERLQRDSKQHLAAAQGVPFCRSAPCEQALLHCNVTSMTVPGRSGRAAGRRSLLARSFSGGKKACPEPLGREPYSMDSPSSSTAHAVPLPRLTGKAGLHRDYLLQKHPLASSTFAGKAGSHRDYCYGIARWLFPPQAVPLPPGGRQVLA